jgi:CheY-like chemotaxis protein
MISDKTILFVEDDPDDRELISEVANVINSSVKMVFAENGLQALHYLTDVKEKLQLPCLIVLDLNMPVLDGKETYKKIKHELKLDDIPVIIFTSSHNPHDKKLFAGLDVEYINKPTDYSFLNQVIRHMISICDKKEL